MEDFGYSKEQEENYISSLIKRAFMIGASLFSIFCFIYITITAVNYFSQNRGEIKTIEAEANPIKVVESQEVESKSSLQIDSSIYEDIFGTRKKKKEKVKVKKVVTPALPPKKVITSQNASNSEAAKGKAKKDSQKIIIYSESEIQDGAKVLLGEAEDQAKSLKNKKASKRYVRVQIAAMTSKRSAYRYFDSLKSQYPQLFKGLEGFVQEVDLGKRGIFYRVQIGNFYDQIRAEGFCKKYVSQTSKTKADCIVVE